MYTAPEFRERGFARTLVTHAKELACTSGHDLVFIIADDDNWPKLLYSSLGFEPIGRIWAFHHEVSSGQPWPAAPVERRPSQPLHARAVQLAVELPGDLPGHARYGLELLP